VYFLVDHRAARSLLRRYSGPLEDTYRKAVTTFADVVPSAPAPDLPGCVGRKVVQDDVDHLAVGASRPAGADDLREFSTLLPSG